LTSARKRQALKPEELVQTYRPTVLAVCLSRTRNISDAEDAVQAEGPLKMHVVMNNFEFDVDLDEVLFSLTPPEGYEVQELDMDLNDLSNLADLNKVRTESESDEDKHDEE